MRKNSLLLLIPLLFIVFGASAQRTTVITEVDNTQPVTVHSIDGVDWASSHVTSPTTGNLYWTYINPSLQAVVMMVEPDGTTTSTVLNGATIPDDNNHAEVTISIDTDGYLHWLGGHHNSPPQYYRSTNSEDISSWDNYSGVSVSNGGMQGHRITYQNFFRSNNGTLFVAYRGNFKESRSYWGMRYIALARYDVVNQVWNYIGSLDYCLSQSDGNCSTLECGDEIGEVAFVWNESGVGDGTDCGSSTSHYQGFKLKVIFDENNGMHVTYNMADSINTSYNLSLTDPSKSHTHIFYAYSPDEGNSWYRADGSQINQFPITKTNGDLVYSKYPDGYTYPDVNYLYNMNNEDYITLTPDGTPLISQRAFFGTDNTTTDLIFTWDGSNWVDITGTNELKMVDQTYTSYSRNEMYDFDFGGVFRISNDDMQSTIDYQMLSSYSTVYAVDRQLLQSDDKLRFYHRVGDLAEIKTFEISTGAALPEISPSGIVQPGGFEVIITSETPSANIRYTTDGTTPTSEYGEIYAGPFTIEEDAEIKAVAYTSTLPTSMVASTSYKLAPPFAYKATIQNVSASDAQSPNIAENAIDGDFNTRWSAEGDQWIQFDLGQVEDIYSIYIAFIRGDQRNSYFDLQVSNDGTNFTTVQSGLESSGEGLDYEEFLVEASGCYLRVYGHGNSSSDWNSYSEAEIWLGDANPTTVTIAPAGGEYDGDEDVNLSSSVTGLDIYYTLDGSDPTSGSTLYTGSFNVSGPHAIVKAAGIDESTGYYEYPPAEEEYYQTLTVEGVATPPTIDGSKDAAYINGSPVQNIVFGENQLDNADDLSGIIYLTSDDDNLYIFAEVKDDNIKDDSDNPFQDDGLELFFDKGNDKEDIFGSDDFYYGFEASGDNFTEYQKGSVNGVEYAVSNVSGGYNMEIKIPFLALGITDAKGHAIGFEATLLDDDDGGNYIESKKAWYNFMNNSSQSPEGWGTMIIVSNKVLDPVLSPAGGIYAGGTSVNISCATPGASIRYTTNGSIPTPTTGIEYTSGSSISVRDTETIKAIAFKSGKENSKVASQSYTVTALPAVDLEIENTPTAPTIDATIESAWDVATAVSCNNVTTGTVSNSDDLSGTFKVMWDDDNFYLLAEVTDDIASNDDDEGGDEKPWKDDGIEFFFDIGNDDPTSYGSDDYQYGFERDGTGMIEYKNGAEAGVTWAASSNTGSYVIEVSIPWTTLGTTPSEFTVFGFDINLVDHDDAGTGIDGKLAWYNTADVAYSDPSTLADAKLKGAPLPWTLSLDNNTNGTISLSPSGGQYADNEVVHASVIGNSGYGFDHWTGDIAAANENDNPVAITMGADKGITANYTAVSTYNLNTSTGGTGSGTIEIDPASGPYNAGTMVLVTANPDEGNDFDGWTGTVNSSSEQIIVEMDAVKNLTANFEPGTSPVIELTVNSGSGSSIGLAEGQEVLINADDPAATYKFSHWSGDVAFVEDANNSLTTVTMPNVSISVTANYESIPVDQMYFVDQTNPNASDADDQPGTEDQPFLTIQRAADVAQAGDYVYIKTGTYRETVVPKNNGQSGNPITFLSYNNDEVIVSGTEELTGWTNVSGNIYKTAMPKGFIEYDQGFTDQIFVNKQMINIARWPNTSLNVSYPKKALVNSASRSGSGPYTGTIDSKLMPPSGDYSTAGIFFWPDSGKWTWSFTGQVQSVSGNEVVFETINDNVENWGTDYTSNSRYFLFGSYNLLDTEGEWYHDTINGELYIWIPGGGDPSNVTVEAKKRNFAFDLSSKHYITVRGLGIFATTITTDNLAGIYNSAYTINGTNPVTFPWKGDDDPEATASHIVMEDLDVKYPTHSLNQELNYFTQWGTNSGIVLAGSDHVVKNCSIQFASDNAISCIGYRHKILNNYIADVAYYGRGYAAVGFGNRFGQLSRDHEIGYNTITRCGRSGITVRNFINSDPNNQVSRIHHNDISHFMLQDEDGGGIYVGPQTDGGFFRIDHNYIHNANEGWIIGGIYLDYSKNFVIDHNICKDMWGPIMLTKTFGTDGDGISNALIYNNTLIAKDRPEGYDNGTFSIAVLGTQEGAIVKNNIMMREGPDYTNFKFIQFPDKFDTDAVSNNVYDSIPSNDQKVFFTNYPTDLTLDPMSTQLIDQGEVITELERDGITVPAFNDPVGGSAPDLGAYEYGMPKFSTGRQDDDVVKYNLVVTSGSGTGSYEEDANVAISANSITGKTFNEWTGDVSYVADANSATTTVTMPAQDIAVTATYEEAACTNPSAPTQNALTVGDGQLTVNWNTVSGADGYKVKYGTSSGSYGTTETVSGGSSTSTTITGLANGTTYYFVVTATDGACESANSNEMSDAPEAGTPTQYTLTTSATNGDITLDPTGGTYDDGADVEATAGADAGYSFVDWEGAATGSTNPVTITMNSNKSLTANFSPILVSSISIPEGDQTITVGNSFQFTKDVTPNDALDQSVTWEVTSGSSYASVDANGLVTALAVGTATITATTNDGSNLSASVEVTVTDGNVDGSITVRVRMIGGASDDLILRIDDNPVYTWNINSGSYQDYSYTGSELSGSVNVKIYFPDHGTDMRMDYIIINGTDTLQTEDQQENQCTWQDGSCGGSYKETMYCQGYINFGTVDFGSGPAPTTYTLATNVGTGGVDVTVNPDQASYDEDEEVTLTPNAQSGYEFLEWTGTETGSSNPLVINMTEDETITANFTPILVSSISIPEGNQSLEVGENYQFTVDITPTDALDQSVTWEVTSGSSYANVDANGLVTANAAGTATITATTNDGSNLSASVEVTVTDGSITLPDPIAWYKFEGDATDALGSHDGAEQNSPSYSTDSKEGSNSISLTSSSSQWVNIDHIDFEDAFNQLTITGWIKANGTSNTQVIYEEGGSWKGLCLRLNNNQLEARAREDNQYNLDVSASFTSTEWKHVAVVFDNGNIELFVDGNPVSTNYTNNFTTVNNHSNAASIGGTTQDAYGSSGNYFDGLLDDIRVYEDALTAAQINSIYEEAGTPAPTTSDTIQAEDFSSMNGITTQDGISGYNGTGYVDYGDDGTWAEWVYNAASSGTVTVDLRYANGSSTRPLAITVDGVSNGSFDCVNTGDWYTWSYISVDITVSAGDNTIRLTADPDQGPNIDELVFNDLNKSAKKYAAIQTITNTSVQVYPNPVNRDANLTLQLTGFENESKVIIYMRDISGRIIYSSNLQTKDMKSVKHSIYTGKFSGGIYMLTVRSNTRIINRQLVIE